MRHRSSSSSTARRSYPHHHVLDVRVLVEADARALAAEARRLDASKGRGSRRDDACGRDEWGYDTCGRHSVDHQSAVSRAQESSRNDVPRARRGELAFRTQHPESDIACCPCVCHSPVLTPTMPTCSDSATRHARERSLRVRGRRMHVRWQVAPPTSRQACRSRGVQLV